MSCGRCAVQARATKAFGRRQKLDWDVFRSPTGVTFIRARKNVGKKTNLGTRVLAQQEYTYEVVNATIEQIYFARQDKPWNEGFSASGIHL